MLSFTLDQSSPVSADRRLRVLVTGAAGAIGSYFSEQASEAYDLRLMVHRDSEDARALERFGGIVVQDLDDLPRLAKVCEGMDVVVHLAGDPSPNAVWDDLLDANVKGTYNLFTAAKMAGCSKVVFASSIHAVSGYPADVQVKSSDPVNPGDLYGVTKCFGEALGRYFATHEGLPVIIIRIGAFQKLSYPESEKSLSMMDAFVSRRDLIGLIRACIDDDKLKFAIFHGLSNNRFKRLDMSDSAELLGFVPQDDFVALNPELAALGLNDSVLTHNVGDEGQKSGLREDIS